MYTYQDFMKVVEERDRSNTDTPFLQWVRGAIDQHKSDENSIANYHTAVLADEYYRHMDRTIVQYQRLLRLADGQTKVDTLGANYKLSSNFLFQDIQHLNQYLLSNGVTWKNDSTAEKLGKDFDKQTQRAGEEALKGGVSFTFYNLNHIEVFSLREFVPFYDEISNQLMAGIRFWQLDNSHPLRATVYTIDGVEELVWGDTLGTVSGGRVLEPKKPYVSVSKGAPADPVKIYNGENYPSFPIVPFYGINGQSELVGRREKIDCYDLLFSGFANTVDEAAYIYWAIEGAGGMDEQDLNTFRDNMRRLHAAAVGEDQRITANAVETPYASREAILQRLRDDLYEDFMMVDTASIKSGSVVTAQIEAAFHNLDMKANLYEYCVLDWLGGLCAVAGIEDEEPTFERSMILNRSEQVQTLLSAAEYLTEDYITQKVLRILGDGDLYNEIVKQREAEESERLDLNPAPIEESDQQWTEETNEQNRS